VDFAGGVLKFEAKGDNALNVQPAIPPTEVPKMGLKFSKQVTLPDIVMEQRVSSTPILKESVSVHAVL
jgi:hypothetical protein